MKSTDGHFYIGSTINTLNYRFNNHKRSAKSGNTSPCYLHFNKIGWDTVTIELVQNYPCASLKELVAKEDEYIQIAKKDPLCLNFKRAYIAPEERADHIKKYIAENKDKIVEYHKQYRVEHKDKRSEYNKKYVAEHAEEVKEKKEVYYEENKRAILAVNRLYVQSHLETVNEYKKKWAKEKRDKLAPIKKVARDEKTAARIAYDNTVVTCACGGTYQNYRKSRHLESKKHAAFTPVSAGV